jgi:Cu2+-containing amine oxidase
MCAGFARFAFAATQYKPSETVNSSPYNQVYLSKPVVAFETFLNAEPARKTDLVAWVSAGLFHIPMAEDAPVTPTTANPIGFSLIPYNWADENPATDMADMVYVTATTPTTALPSAAGAIKCSPRFASIPFQSDNKFD